MAQENSAAKIDEREYMSATGINLMHNIPVEFIGEIGKINAEQEGIDKWVNMAKQHFINIKTIHAASLYAFTHLLIYST